MKAGFEEGPRARFALFLVDQCKPPERTPVGRRRLMVIAPGQVAFLRVLKRPERILPRGFSSS